MKKRTNVIAAALALGAAAVIVGLPGEAGAQTGVSPPPAAKASLPPRPEEPVLIAPDALFSKPVNFGHAWARALRVVFARMKAYVEEERVAAEKTVEPPGLFPRTAAWSTLTVPTRYVVGPRDIVRAAPLPIEPPTYAAGDTHGESGVLLGVAIELPWLVP